MYIKGLYDPLVPKGVSKYLTGLLYEWISHFSDLIFLPFCSIVLGILVCDEDSILKSRSFGHCNNGVNYYI
jgi:hypothetical protein